MASVIGPLPGELHRIHEDEPRRAVCAGGIERQRFGREARDLRQLAGVERDRCWRVEVGRRRRDEREVQARVAADRHRDAGCERPVQHGLCLLSFQNPRRSDRGLGAKRAGRVKAAPAASAASEALTRPSASAESRVRGGGCGEAVHFVLRDLRRSRLEGDDLRALRRECLGCRDGTSSSADCRRTWRDPTICASPCCLQLCRRATASAATCGQRRRGTRSRLPTSSEKRSSGPEFPDDQLQECARPLKLRRA